jgi:hypothetical protein
MSTPKTFCPTIYHHARKLRVKSKHFQVFAFNHRSALPKKNVRLRVGKTRKFVASAIHKDLLRKSEHFNFREKGILWVYFGIDR